MSDDQQPAGPSAPFNEVELPETGYGALIAWCANRAHVIRRAAPAPDPRRVTSVVKWADGREEHFVRGFDDSDVAAIDHEINDYLAAAGIPPRPSHYRWYLRVPRWLSGDKFWTDLELALDRDLETAPEPGAIRRVLETVVPQLLEEHSSP